MVFTVFSSISMSHNVFAFSQLLAISQLTSTFNHVQSQSILDMCSTGCTTVYFTCESTGQQVPPLDRCNGRPDCPDNSDEINCTLISSVVYATSQCQTYESICCSDDDFDIGFKCLLNTDDISCCCNNTFNANSDGVMKAGGLAGIVAGMVLGCLLLWLVLCRVFNSQWNRCRNKWHRYQHQRHVHHLTATHINTAAANHLGVVDATHPVTDPLHNSSTRCVILQPPAYCELQERGQNHSDFCHPSEQEILPPPYSSIFPETISPSAHVRTDLADSVPTRLTSTIIVNENDMCLKRISTGISQEDHARCEIFIVGNSMESGTIHGDQDYVLPCLANGFEIQHDDSA